MPYSPLRPYPKSRPLDPNYAPEGMLACLPAKLDGFSCDGCRYAASVTWCPILDGDLVCRASHRPDGQNAIFKPR